MVEGPRAMIYNGKHLIHYGQVALLDAEDRDAYPDPIGPLPWLGHKGIVVPAQNDAEIDVELHETGPPDLSGLNRLTEAIICIGGHGLLVGNITTASTAGVPWPEGDVDVTVYHEGTTPADATRVVFVLKHLNG
jgi:hypothetical protein